MVSVELPPGTVSRTNLLPWASVALTACGWIVGRARCSRRSLAVDQTTNARMPPQAAALQRHAYVITLCAWGVAAHEGAGQVAYEHLACTWWGRQEGGDALVSSSGGWCHAELGVMPSSHAPAELSATHPQRT